ncbi:putative polyketide synthase [Mollisia scopiformis]|uniref:Putative polyketide synthase n=1 Tax=Mollisia scopiformis TaxID=149040 RepID=A0A194WXU9_MOLSC|nr:putative polyketide synthase [Mollisia scopiformis]KUJ12798.1 putative polyketide synthase [Mollisia scopiformis]
MSNIPRSPYLQEAIAVIGMACRLPGDCNSPNELWDFLDQGRIAKNEAPETRFNLNNHHDGSKKPKTMRSPGGMFLENVDPQDFDAQFFGIRRDDAIAMDPNQRQLLEVVYECLENAGISLKSLDGKAVGCFVASYAVDYSDIHARDPEDRVPSVIVGTGRAILSNRISHFLNIRGPSLTVDTACSGSLVSLDIACRYLTTGEINGAIVAASNLYLSPEHNMDEGTMIAVGSPSGRCHSFDAKADGYIKSEAIQAVMLKRLSDAIRDGDPIRAIIRGSATNSDGRTPGIASPSAEAQAAAIRAAYSNAGISDIGATAYVECHGTGTPAGDPIEVSALASVFAHSKTSENPLVIGSIKSNIGHSEPAAGLSGLLKGILCLEKGLIPRNPTFLTPNPKIDFATSRMVVPTKTMKWPRRVLKRVSINAFGYGGSNAHVIIDHFETSSEKPSRIHVSSFTADFDDLFNDQDGTRPFTLVFSANDEASLRSYCKAICKHLINPNVAIKLPDLSYTLSERRSRLFHRAYVVADETTLDEGAFVFGKKNASAPRIGFVFSGQGAQWPQMGKALIETFPVVKAVILHLDEVLQGLMNPPSWSLLHELVEPRSAEHMRKPEFSQPLATALQLALVALLKGWGVCPMAVVGHSSGEIAGAYASGFLEVEDAIKIAYLRGQACVTDQEKPSLGMLAVGLGQVQVQEYIREFADFVQIGCLNSPNSVTLSGARLALEDVRDLLVADGHFVRMLQVDFAYHSAFMADAAVTYEAMLLQHCGKAHPTMNDVVFFSSITGKQLDRPCDAEYWKTNMTSPVRFDDAVREMLLGHESADFLIEIGPSGALAGPIKQILKSLTNSGSDITYLSSLSRGKDATKPLFDLAGKLFIMGGNVFLSEVNKDQTSEAGPSIIVDLPNYAWNHATKYWYENDASKDWRFRKFPHHDLLGSKILGTSWNAPSWKKTLRVEDLHWLKDHRMGQDIVFPAAAFIAMGVEALFQTTQALNFVARTELEEKYHYRLRNITFSKALVLSENSSGQKIMTTLSVSQDSWHEFRVSSLVGDIWTEHNCGLICLEQNSKQVAPESALMPFEHAVPGHTWYKAMHEVGYNFLPLFQKVLEIEVLSGERKSRSRVSLSEPVEEYQQSYYPMHPVCIDGCLQTLVTSLWKGNRTSVNYVLIPSIIDNIIIRPLEVRPVVGISVTSAAYAGVGRKDDTKNFRSDASVYDEVSGGLLFAVSGVRYHRLDVLEQQNAAQTYGELVWQPDVAFLTEESFSKVLNEEAACAAQEEALSHHVERLLDMIVHKSPNLKVIEFSLYPNDVASTWFDGPSTREFSRFEFATFDATSLMTLQETYGVKANTSFSLLDLTKPMLNGGPGTASQDLCIVKMPLMSQSASVPLFQNISGLLRDGGYVLCMCGDESSTSSSDFEGAVIVKDKILQFGCDVDISNTLQANGFQSKISMQFDGRSLHLAQVQSTTAVKVAADRELHIIHLTHVTETQSIVSTVLIQLGWQIREYSVNLLPKIELDPKSNVLVLDELSASVLTNVSGEQWEAIKGLVSKEGRILWVTAGSQFEVAKPDRALVYGLARVIRAEEPMVSFVTLDVESSSSSETTSAIHNVLKYMQEPGSGLPMDMEFVERRGIMHVSRVRPYEKANQAEMDDKYGADFQTKNFHESDTCIRLICESIGRLDSLCYVEVSCEELPLGDNFLEVEIYAAGLNFKDVAVPMGIVPGNDHLLGLEGAGIIRRIGRLIDHLHVNQRVLVYMNNGGAFANRVQVAAQLVHPLPNSMSFEQAATMPSVYLVSIYSLLHLASMQKNHRVLIHSASGGVGIAAIQLCQYRGAQVFATVGTPEKRQFLIDTFGIPPEHIFSSRSTVFATELMAATQGQGVNIILNSLTGELLDESWRCVADGGHMIEIGKKDILARNSLSLEPFNRNASFHGVDMSHEQNSDELIAKLLSELMQLVKDGHVKPIAPMSIFPFEDIVSAIRFLRAGTHLGKVVISNGAGNSFEVPVRPAARSLCLDPSASYLIVGGLKGLCGSLAVYLASLGAKHLSIICRSGYSDPQSQAVLANIASNRCDIELFIGDVAVLEDVQRVFDDSTVPIKGVIHGAMVLRDRVYSAMTSADFHTSLPCKVLGTQNLHTASLTQSQPLEFFTLLSSISGVIGQKGQANYAAANVFLDSFASHRHSLGLPACSIDLGVIEDVGYVAANTSLQQKLDGDVWISITERRLQLIVRESILQQETTSKSTPKNQVSQLITGIAMPQSASSALLKDPRFLPLCFGNSSNSASTSASSSPEGKALRAFHLLLSSSQTALTPDSSLSDPALSTMLVSIICQQFTTFLRLDSPIEPAKSLSSYGLDSLAVVEFRNWTRREIGAELTTLEILNATSIFSLCEKILAVLLITKERKDLE